MRRTDRQITDIALIEGIISKCEVCHLGLSLDNKPYVVPLSYGYTLENGRLTLYFHGAKQGKKLDIIRGNSSAFFVIDGAVKLVSSADACSFTTEYESVMGEGTVSICGDGEKAAALGIIMAHYAPGKVFDFPPQAVNAVEVLRFDVDSFSAKALKK